MSNGEAHRDVMKTLREGEVLVSMRYNKRNGNANITTRAFEPFPELDPESETSKMLNQAIEDFRNQSGALQRDREQLDAREAKILRRERGLDQREALIKRGEDQIEGEKKELERQREKMRRGRKFDPVGRIKSFFHRQT